MATSRNTIKNAVLDLVRSEASNSGIYMHATMPIDLRFLLIVLGKHGYLNAASIGTEDNLKVEYLAITKDEGSDVILYDLFRPLEKQKKTFYRNVADAVGIA